MTRGNQRELARQKAQKKLSETKKGVRTDGLSLTERKMKDADIMREKQRKKEEEAAAKQQQQKK